MRCVNLVLNVILIYRQQVLLREVVNLVLTDYKFYSVIRHVNLALNAISTDITFACVRRQ